MSYLKRQKIPKNWPIKRKGSAYVARPNFSINKGIPVLIILRDICRRIIMWNSKDFSFSAYSSRAIKYNC